MNSSSQAISERTRQDVHKDYMATMKACLKNHLASNIWLFLNEESLEDIEFDETVALSVRKFIKDFTSSNYSQTSVVDAVNHENYVTGKLGGTDNSALSKWLNYDRPSPTTFFRIVKFLWLVWNAEDSSGSLPGRDSEMSQAVNETANLLQSLQLEPIQASSTSIANHELNIKTSPAEIQRSPYQLKVLNWTLDVRVELQGGYENRILPSIFRVLSCNDADLILLRGGHLDSRFWNENLLLTFGLTGYNIIKTISNNDENEEDHNRLVILYKTTRFTINEDVIRPYSQFQRDSMMIALNDTLLNEAILFSNLYSFESGSFPEHHIWPDNEVRQSFPNIISVAVYSITRVDKFFKGLKLLSSIEAVSFNEEKDGEKRLAFRCIPFVWTFAKEGNEMAPPLSARDGFLANNLDLLNRETTLYSRLDRFHPISTQFRITCFNLNHGALPPPPNKNKTGFAAAARAMFRAVVETHPHEVILLQELLALTLDHELVEYNDTFINHSHNEAAIFISNKPMFGRNLSEDAYNLDLSQYFENNLNSRNSTSREEWIQFRTVSSVIYLKGQKIILISFHGNSMNGLKDKISMLHQLVNILQKAAHKEHAPVILGGDFNIQLGGGSTPSSFTSIRDFWNNLSVNWILTWSDLLDYPNVQPQREDPVDFLMVYNPPELDYYLDFYDPRRIEVLNRDSPNGFGPALREEQIRTISNTINTEEVPNRASYVLDHCPIDAVVRMHYKSVYKSKFQETLKTQNHDVSNDFLKK